MNHSKRFILAIMITLLVTVWFGIFYLQNEINELRNETKNTPSAEPSLPSLKPNVTPTPTPNIMPTPTHRASPPPILKSANLVLNCMLESGFYVSRNIDGKEVPSIRVNGTLTNIGEETAYNITLHVISWFSNGTQSFITDLPLIWEVLVPPPFLRPSIKGNETLVMPQNDLSGVISVPDDVKGTDWTNATAYSDCISSYQITAIWD
jgi:hypothetical protein